MMKTLQENVEDFGVLLEVCELNSRYIGVRDPMPSWKDLERMANDLHDKALREGDGEALLNIRHIIRIWGLNPEEQS